jgi:NAD(P)H-dependent FMN reductase
MITLICGTNRPGSMSGKVAAFYRTRLEKKHVEHRFFSLFDMPQDLLNNRMYDYNSHPEMIRIQEEILIPASKFIFVFPEYNGGFPGILKAFIDASDIRACWHNKKACLVGVSSGRAGNLRGMEHFTNLLNHMRINVLHLKIPISSIGSVMDEAGQLTAEETVALIDRQIDLLNEF